MQIGIINLIRTKYSEVH